MSTSTQKAAFNILASLFGTENSSASIWAPQNGPKSRNDPNFERKRNEITASLTRASKLAKQRDLEDNPSAPNHSDKAQNNTAAFPVNALPSKLCQSREHLAEPKANLAGPMRFTSAIPDSKQPPMTSHPKTLPPHLQSRNGQCSPQGTKPTQSNSNPCPPIHVRKKWTVNPLSILSTFKPTISTASSNLENNNVKPAKCQQFQKCNAHSTYQTKTSLSADTQPSKPLRRKHLYYPCCSQTSEEGHLRFHQQECSR